MQYDPNFPPQAQAIGSGKPWGPQGPDGLTIPAAINQGMFNTLPLRVRKWSLSGTFAIEGEWNPETESYDITYEQREATVVLRRDDSDQFPDYHEFPAVNQGDVHKILSRPCQYELEDPPADYLDDITLVRLIVGHSFEWTNDSPYMDLVWNRGMDKIFDTYNLAPISQGGNVVIPGYIQISAAASGIYGRQSIEFNPPRTLEPIDVSLVSLGETMVIKAFTDSEGPASNVKMEAIEYFTWGGLFDSGTGAPV